MKDDLVVLMSAVVVAVFAPAMKPAPTPPAEVIGSTPAIARDLLDDVALAPYFDDIEFQNAGDAVLWIDQEGNVAVRLPVEQVVFFDANGTPIGAGLSERCARSTSSSLRPTILVCLAVDDLVPK